MPSFTDRGLVVIQAKIGPDEDCCACYHNRCDPPPRDIVTSALIDTGAEVCIVDLDILKALRIEPHDKRGLKGVTGETENHPVFSVWLKVCTKDGSIVINQSKQEVFGLPAENKDYRVILGMDVLRSVTLKMNHSKKMVQICPTIDEDGAA